MATSSRAQEPPTVGVVVSGSVADETGEPIGGAVVLLLDTELVTTTLSGGSFELAFVPPGDYVLEARLPGYTVASLEILVESEALEAIELRLIAVETPLDEIVVTASHSILREEPTSTVGLGRQEIEKLPHFGDDLFRAITVLPGTSGGNISAAFNVRGGFFEEVLTRIDGQEIIEPFHLKDFQGVFSILDSRIVAGVDLIPGGYPAEYGDRMTGVLDIRTSRPSELRTSLGVSFSNVWAGNSGTFADGKGRWLGSARRGFLDLVLAFSEDSEDSDEEQPDLRYWDLFGKISYDLGPSQSLGLEVLSAEDTLSFEEIEDDEMGEVDTSYGNRYLWATHRALLRNDTFVDTLASIGHVDRDRVIFFTEERPPETIDVRDVRDTEVLTLKQDWGSQVAERHLFKWGFEARRWDVTYDYLNEAQLADPIDDPRFLPGERLTRFVEDFSGEQYALYFADRMRFGKSLTAEIGLRWDRQTLIDEDQVSPRVNLVCDLGSGGVLRGGWGHFYQSQRPYELAVQFGETEFQPSSRAEHWLLGYENLVRGYRVRADLFKRDITDAQVRYETLFDPFNVLPEARIDLVTIPAETASSNGIELSLRAPVRPKLNWWLSYSLSSVEDEVLGKSVDRSIDQTHAVTASLSWRPAKKWHLTWVGFYHTGWPTTPVSAELIFDSEGEPMIDYDVGAFYSERWNDYYRVDFRASRTTDVGKDGTLTFFLDVQNLFNRDNPRGLEITDADFRLQPDGTIEATFPVESWLPILPSFGVVWEF